MTEKKRITTEIIDMALKFLTEEHTMALKEEKYKLAEWIELKIDRVLDVRNGAPEHLLFHTPKEVEEFVEGK